MNKEDIIKFKEELSNISLKDIKDKELFRELQNLFLFIGDYLAMFKSPIPSTYPRFAELQKMKREATELKYNLKLK